LTKNFRYVNQRAPFSGNSGSRNKTAYSEFRNYESLDHSILILSHIGKLKVLISKFHRKTNLAKVISLVTAKLLRISNLGILRVGTSKTTTFQNELSVSIEMVSEIQNL
jgi:hypothetical protein